MSQDERRGERRRTPRVVVDAPVRLRTGRDTVPGRLRDICRDAALVEVHRHFDPGEEVSLEFELSEEDGPVQVSGRVIRVAPGDGDASGVAILFENLQPAAEGRIEMFLHRQE